MRDDFHPPVEEYLQVVQSLADEGIPVIQARVAERLHKSAPSVSEMIDRLVDDGYLVRSGRDLQLTPTGQQIARGVIRKHRLAERLLLDVIGLPWHLVHEEAGRWEHVMSDEVEGRIVALLGDPGECPHGNPIPGSAHEKQVSADQRPLSNRIIGDVVRFESLGEGAEADVEAMFELSEAGFLPGATASVFSKDATGTVVLHVKNSALSIRREITEQLFVVCV
jgi:DtxR family transcriptional regulator, Mn-dependent transcriptional regulator